MRPLLAFLLSVGCGAARAPEAAASTTPASNEPALTDGATESGTLEVDGILFAACALEACPDDVRVGWGTLGRALATIAAAPERTPPLVEAEREVWSRAVLEPYMDGVRADLEGGLRRLYEGIESDPERALRYWVGVLVWYRRFADYLDRNGAGPPNADRGGCGRSLAVELHRALETARDAASHCARAAALVPSLADDARRCADAETALRARLALEVDDGVICDPELPE